jgi:hypothetical protein
VRRALLLLTLVGATAACGGGDGKRLTRAEYVRRADAICGRYNAAVKKLATPKSPPAIVDFADKSLALLDAALADERKLRPPAQLDATEERWLAQAQVVRGDVADLGQVARKGQAVKIERILEKGARDDMKANATAAELGLKVCSKP